MNEEWMQRLEVVRAVRKTPGDGILYTRLPTGTQMPETSPGVYQHPRNIRGTPEIDPAWAHAESAKNTKEIRLITYLEGDEHEFKNLKAAERWLVREYWGAKREAECAAGAPAPTLTFARLRHARAVREAIDAKRGSAQWRDPIRIGFVRGHGWHLWKAGDDGSGQALAFDGAKAPRETALQAASAAIEAHLDVTVWHMGDGNSDKAPFKGCRHTVSAAWGTSSEAECDDAELEKTVEQVKAATRAKVAEAVSGCLLRHASS